MYNAAALVFHLVLMGALGFQSVWSSRNALAFALLLACDVTTRVDFY